MRQLLPSAALLSVVLVLGAEESSPAQQEAVSQIAFVSERDGNSEIYVINSDGSGLTNLTNHPADDHAPAWSPDGSRIAFRSRRGEGAPTPAKPLRDGCRRLQPNPLGHKTTWR